MMNAAKNCALFLEQQIELYGDDFCLAEVPNITIDESDQPVHPVIGQNTSEGKETAAAFSDGLVWQNVDSLDDLDAAINTCQKCALGHTRHTFVFGAGPANADVMFIGEAPGAEEDRLGKPFVGAAGDLLSKILAAINFKLYQRLLLSASERSRTC